jgi:hypothetical protein
MEITAKTNGIFIFSINDYRYLDDVRVWLNLAIDSAPSDYPAIDNMIIVINDPDQHDFSDIFQLSMTFTDGIMTAWEVLV